MSNIARVEQKQELVPATENNAMVSMFERMASDPNVDVDKLERLMQMRERAVERQAKADFDAAMADMQPELPTIGERGKAMVDSKVRYTYAQWEDINTAIKPVLQKHGFALTFRTDFKNGITVTGVLSHRNGHREETSIMLPADASGGKNAVQAVASSVSYGKRYTGGALLNLTSHGEDDDAYRAAVETVSDAQEIQISDMLEATGSDKAKFLKWLKVEKVSDIPAKSFDSVMVTLKAKERAK
jgi:hypothetical protein